MVHPSFPSSCTRRRGLIGGLAGLLLLAGCGPAGDGARPGDAAGKPVAEAAPAAPPKLPVVVTFTILADMVATVGGDRVEVATLVGPDSDAHVFSPTPAAAKTIAAAKVVFVNGLGFEGWMDKLIAASGYKGPLVVASDGVEVLKVKPQPHSHRHGHSHGHDHGEVDPHAWQSLSNARRYVANIADALAAADPAHEAGYRARAKAYDERLAQLDEKARARLGAIPASERRVIVGHDAFGYFARAYGLTFLSPRGVSTDSEASAKDVAQLARQIRSQRIRAVFVENISDPRLVEQLARESGARVGGTLFSDALSAKDKRALTYIDMMSHNIEEVAKALAPSGPGS
ncbi:MAG: metal ABC transporter solute-binding protein, Zn/Mn family [bacterium]|jgi:zinc/manganese transport system substrate-binding protein|nr:zinc ABC transporter substrate-binding protein [Betaproteobacteria bacterium]